MRYFPRCLLAKSISLLTLLDFLPPAPCGVAQLVVLLRPHPCVSSSNPPIYVAFFWHYLRDLSVTMDTGQEYRNYSHDHNQKKKFLLHEDHYNNRELQATDNL